MPAQSRTVDVEADLRALPRLSGEAREKVRKRLLEAGAQMDRKIPVLERRLEEYYGNKDMPDEEWIGKLHEYERLCDMRDAIRREVL